MRNGIPSSRTPAAKQKQLSRVGVQLSQMNNNYDVPENKRYGLAGLFTVGIVAAWVAMVSSSNQTAWADEPPASSLKTAVDKSIGTAPNDQDAKQQRSSARELSAAFRNAAARMLPSVVTVKVRTRETEAGGVIDVIGGNDASFDSLGSGVIMSKDGLILTNHHVVKDGKRIEVMLIDGRQYEARDVKSDPPSDLAILRIDVPEELPAAPVGDSRELSVGDWVLAIGSPFSLDSTVSAGIISGKNRRISDLLSGYFLQTDAAVNPGNSGGALIDLDGQIVGINTAISSSSGSFQGIGFAIPINRAIWVKNELLARGRVRQARMGAQLGSIKPDIAKQLQLTAGGGAYIVSTVSGRPAEKAGMMPGDIVINFDHQNVSNLSELAEIIKVSSIDQELEVVILRAGQKKTLSIKLEARD